MLHVLCSLFQWSPKYFSLSFDLLESSSPKDSDNSIAGFISWENEFILNYIYSGKSKVSKNIPPADEGILYSSVYELNLSRLDTDSREVIAVFLGSQWKGELISMLAIAGTETTAFLTWKQSQQNSFMVRLSLHSKDSCDA